jgi:hypothetical protein
MKRPTNARKLDRGVRDMALASAATEAVMQNVVNPDRMLL